MPKLPASFRLGQVKTQVIVTVIVLIFIIAGAYFFGMPAVKKLFHKETVSVQESDVDGPTSSRDIAAPDLFAFTLEKIDLSKEENSYYDLQKIVNSEVKTPILPQIMPTGDDRYELDYHLDLSLWGEGEAERLIRLHRSNTDNFLAAAQKVAYQNPGTSNPNNFNLGIEFTGVAIRRAARAVALEAVLLVDRGDDHSAFRQSLDIIKVGHLIEISQGTGLEMLLGFDIKGIGLGALQQIISYSAMPTDQMSVYFWELDSYRMSYNTDFVNFRILEFNRVLSEVVSDPEWEVGDIEINDYSFQPNRTMAAFIEGIQKNKKNYVKPCHIDEEFFFSPGQIVGLTPQQLEQENYVGMMLLDTVDSNCLKLKENRCVPEMHLAAVRILGAIKQYLLDHDGEYPHSLKSLVPDYLDSLPKDPYSGSDFVYSYSEKTIRSVGKTGEGNGKTFDLDFYVFRPPPLDPSQADTDGDGLSDLEEREVYGTDPNNVDSDGDGFWDGVEVESGNNPAGEGTL